MNPREFSLSIQKVDPFKISNANKSEIQTRDTFSFVSFVEATQQNQIFTETNKLLQYCYDQINSEANPLVDPSEQFSCTNIINCRTFSLDNNVSKERSARDSEFVVPEFSLVSKPFNCISISQVKEDQYLCVEQNSLITKPPTYLSTYDLDEQYQIKLFGQTNETNLLLENVLLTQQPNYTISCSSDQLTGDEPSLFTKMPIYNSEICPSSKPGESPEDKLQTQPFTLITKPFASNLQQNVLETTVRESINGKDQILYETHMDETKEINEESKFAQNSFVLDIIHPIIDIDIILPQLITPFKLDSNETNAILRCAYKFQREIDEEREKQKEEEKRKEEERIAKEKQKAEEERKLKEEQDKKERQMFQEAALRRQREFEEKYMRTKPEEQQNEQQNKVNQQTNIIKAPISAENLQNIMIFYPLEISLCICHCNNKLLGVLVVIKSEREGGLAIRPEHQMHLSRVVCVAKRGIIWDEEQKRRWRRKHG